MKKYTPAQLIPLLAGPVVTVLLGLVLLFSPDTASALVGKLIAWCCILAAAALGVGVLLRDSVRRNNRITWVVVFFAAGIWMLLNPLTIARILGRLLGIGLLIRGGQKLSGELEKDAHYLDRGPDPGCPAPGHLPAGVQHCGHRADLRGHCPGRRQSPGQKAAGRRPGPQHHRCR